VSAYSIDGFFNSLIEVEGIHGWVNSTGVAPLTTDTVNILLPGIVDYYGSGLPVAVHFNAISINNF